MVAEAEACFRLAGIRPDQRGGQRGDVPLVEDQIEDGEDPGESLGEQFVRRDAVRDAGFADLALRSDQALGHGGLR